jgi:hypothetical protein
MFLMLKGEVNGNEHAATALGLAQLGLGVF